MQSGAKSGLPERTRTERPLPLALSGDASAHLDMLRAVAAFAVLFGHWRNIFFLNWPEVHSRNIFLEFFYGSTKFGHEAVVVFFVLSGFLIGRTVLRAVWSGRWSFKHYAFHRIVRLEIVLLPALLLCWLWDTAGIHLFSPSPTYLGTSGSSVIAYNIGNWLSPHIFFGNLFFLQTLLTPPFGSDNALWSLANEFWYYVLFPLLVICLTRSFSWFGRCISAIVMIAVALFIGKWMLGGFFIWLMGTLLIFLPAPKRLSRRAHSLLAIVAFLLILVQLAITFDPRSFERGLNTDYVLAILVAAFLYALLHHPLEVGNRYRKIAKSAAGFSYTLYLTHLPVLVFFAAWLNFRGQPTARNFMTPGAVLCLTIAYSYLVATIFERNTDKVRKRLESMFHL